jgi:ABC-2 type transport system ATP-binding protein
MRVRDQLVVLGRLSGLSAAAAAREAGRWLAELGLADRAGARLDDLSHGNQQRVQLAAALVHAPELLVLDEPFSGLDPFAMDAMSVLLTRLARTGTAVLFSSHQLDVVEHLCEDVVVIDAGRVVLSGELDAIREAAADRYLDVSVAGDDVSPVLHLPGAVLVEGDRHRVRLRLDRAADPVALLAALPVRVLRLRYEPPSLSELFRDAVTGAGRGVPGRAVPEEAVSGVAG